MIYNNSNTTVNFEAISHQSKLIEAFKSLKSYISTPPEIGIILGSGLGRLPNNFSNPKLIPYSNIPHFPISKIKGHKGQFVLGQFEGKTILAMQGRVHFYEGYSMQSVTFGVRLMQKLGIKTLIITNASGGLREEHYPGSICFIEDHINLMNANPLRGDNLEEFGVRFPDMSQAYDPFLLKLGKKSAEEIGIQTFTGVYAAVSGPNYETPAEIKFLKILGADLVGMSTVPEVIVAVHGGMKVLGISCITDVPVHQEETSITHEAVLKAASNTEKNFIKLISKIIQKL